MNRTRKLGLSIILVAFMAVGLAACGGADDTAGGSSDSGGEGGGDQLSLVAFSTPEVVYDELTPAFQKTTGGKGVTFKSSFGASGEQSRAVEGGLKADVVNFSLAPDVDKLVDAGLVSKDWTKATPYDGFVSTSLVSFIVRKGNPKGIKGWDDLIKDDVKVVTPNPFTSGAAKWNLLGGFQHGGLDYVEKLIKDHVPVQPKSGREALQAFTSGQGDVLISYEYEYTTAVKKGEKDLELVVPEDTLLIQNPIAVTKDAKPAAKKFVDYTLSPEGQQFFADWGYRPVNPETLKKNKSKFPDPKKVTTIAKLGGWPKLNDELFDPENGKIAKIEEDAGVSTAK
ncbi:MAG TPA: sulfate ABC transporter substrate-binding protein [Thermoleophilaceae bacterium]|nr:sulfate ABC transporter substrate-binding protein [Thermoleophilaceae bacterium]